MTIKNLPTDVYERLKRSASANRRSLNSEAIVCLERALGTRRAEPAILLEEIRALRNRLGSVKLTDADLAEARSQGRP